MLKPFFKQNW